MREETSKSWLRGTDRQQHDWTTDQQITIIATELIGYDCNGLGHLVRKMVKYIKFCWSACRGSACYSPMKTNKETHTFTKTWSQHDDTAVHSSSSSFLSKSASQLCFTSTRDCHRHFLGSWSNALSVVWYTVSADSDIMARFKVKSALTNPCFPTLTEMKGQDVCVKMKLRGSSLLTEQIDIKMESIPL